MSSLTPYLALASFPAAYLLGFNPIRFSWGLRHGFKPMPAELRDRVEAVDRYVYFFVYAVLIGFLATLMHSNSIRAAHVGLGLRKWQTGVALGLASGVALILVQAAIVRLRLNGPPLETTDRFQRRSLALWLSVSFVASFTEEFWIAFCLVAMTATGHSDAMAVALTATVFGVIHLAYRFYGALSVAARGAVSALFFIWTGSLIPMFLFHFLGSLGNLYWLRRSAPVAGGAGRPDR